MDLHYPTLKEASSWLHHFPKTFGKYDIGKIMDYWGRLKPHNIPKIKYERDQEIGRIKLVIKKRHQLFVAYRHSHTKWVVHLGQQVTRTKKI